MPCCFGILPWNVPNNKQFPMQLWHCSISCNCSILQSQKCNKSCTMQMLTEHQIIDHWKIPSIANLNYAFWIDKNANPKYLIFILIFCFWFCAKHKIQKHLCQWTKWCVQNLLTIFNFFLLHFEWKCKNSIHNCINNVTCDKECNSCKLQNLCLVHTNFEFSINGPISKPMSICLFHALEKSIRNSAQTSDWNMSQKAWCGTCRSTQCLRFVHLCMAEKWLQKPHFAAIKAEKGMCSAVVWLKSSKGPLFWQWFCAKTGGFALKKHQPLCGCLCLLKK